MVKVLLIFEDERFYETIERGMVRNRLVGKVFLGDLLNVSEMALEIIRGISWDYFVIIAEDKMFQMAVKLLSICGVGRDTGRNRIVNFVQLFKNVQQIPKVQKVMSNPRYDEIKGLILGLSHAEVGLISSMFPQLTCNIATGAQDIFYNLRCLQYCGEHHKNHLRTLEYVIFDMYDYSYFNTDTSLGKNAVNYFLNWDGFIWDGHHFDRNKNFDFSYEELLDQIQNAICEGIEVGEKEAFLQLFPEVMKITGYDEFSDDFKVRNISKIVTQDEIDNYDIESSVLTQRFEGTEKENIALFGELLALLKNINENMVIKIILMPRVCQIEERMVKYDSLLRPRFYEIMNGFIDEGFNIEIIDLKGLEEISLHNEYYYDVEHLNHKGAECFTKYFIQNHM